MQNPSPTRRLPLACLPYTCIFALGAALAGSSEASHNHVEANFDAEVPPGWSSEPTALDPLGGRYLGPFDDESVSWFLMDVLPAENAQTGEIDSVARLARLEFDLVLPDPAALAGGTFNVEANDELILSEPIDLLLTHQSARFLFEPSPDLFSTDLVVTFSNQGAPGGQWGLDNVVVDWGQPVPEPAALSLALLTGLGALGWAGPRS